MYEEIEGELAVYLHTGDPRYDYSHPRRLRRVLDDFPNLTVVAAHLGGYSVFDAAQEYLRDTKCLIDVSSSIMFTTPEKAVEYIRGFGADRAMFGSDFPLWSPDTEAERFFSLPLSESEREQIAHLTAEEFLGL
jgi:predicted TIM-barrel fold metal-dependent hydrolase